MSDLVGNSEDHLSCVVAYIKAEGSMARGALCYIPGFCSRLSDETSH